MRHELVSAIVLAKLVGIKHFIKYLVIMKILKSLVTSVLLVVALAVPFSSNAQEESKGKPNVFIDYFSRPAEVSFSIVEQLRGCVMEAIMSSNRVELIDVDSNELLRIEQERREAGAFAGDDMDRIKVMSQEGANFLISGRVASVSITETKADDGTITYVACISGALKVVNPNDGKTILNKSYEFGGSIGGIIPKGIIGSSTKEDAVTKACNEAKDKVVSFIQEAFPLFGHFLEVNQVKGDKVESFYMDLGEINGLAKKDRFEVCIVREVAKRKSVKVIGECEVEAVEGDDISLCKVKKGHKELKAALDGGQEIVLKSMPKKEKIIDEFNPFKK